MKRSILKVILVMLIAFLISLAWSFLMFIRWENYSESINEFVSILALVVSVIALVMALLTYFSIDSVNKKSTLEGNVLENEAYTISIVNKLKQYSKYEDDDDILKCLFEEQYRVIKKKSKTNIQFTDILQMLIDDYAILGWCNLQSTVFAEMSKKSLAFLDRRITKLEDYSNGSQHIVEENYKMIKYLYSSNFSREELDGIRGDLFKNPYTRYLYFDSIGRQYYWEIAPHIGIKSGCITLEEIREMKNQASKVNDTSKMKLWIDKSLEAMNYANAISIYNKPYTVFINNFIFRLSILRSIYFGIDNVEECFLENKKDWDILIAQLGIDFTNMKKSYLWTSIFKSYYRLIFSYNAYCAVYSKLPESWLDEMNTFNEQYSSIGNLSSHENLIDLEPCINDYEEMERIYHKTYK